MATIAMLAGGGQDLDPQGNPVRFTQRDKKFPVVEQPKDFARSHTDVHRDIMKLDGIDKVHPRKLEVFTNKPALDEIPGTRPAEVVRKEPRRGPEYQFTTSDIEGAKAKVKDGWAWKRHINPLDPEYKLPSAPEQAPLPPAKQLHDTNNVKDIQGTQPNPLYRYETREIIKNDDIDASYVGWKPYHKRRVDPPRDQQECRDINGERWRSTAHRDAQDPVYVWDTEKGRGRIGEDQDAAGLRSDHNDKTAKPYGYIAGSRPRPARKQKEVELCLDVHDIVGEERLSDLKPRNRTQFRNTNYIQDIPGTTPKQPLWAKEDAPAEELEHRLRHHLLEQGPGNTGFDDMMKIFGAMDADKNKKLDRGEFRDGLIEYGVMMREQEIQRVFNMYDKDRSGAIDAKEFVEHLRGPLDRDRMNLVHRAFTMLDKKGEGVVTLDSLKQHIMNGKDKSDKQAMQRRRSVVKFFERQAGGRGNVDVRAFEDYFGRMSSCIDEDRDFSRLLQGSLGVKIPISRPPSASRPSTPAPRTNIDDLTNDIKSHFSEVGIDESRYYSSFQAMDKNGNHTVDKAEFRDGLKNMGAKLHDKEIDVLFKHYDRDASGGIDVEEFLVAVKGSLNAPRRALVQAAFEKLDADRSGEVELDEVAKHYNSKSHPKVKKGLIASEQACQEFVRQLKLGKYGNDYNKLSYKEFEEYYAGVSAVVDDDGYFEQMMNKAWGVGRTSRTAGVEGSDLTKVSTQGSLELTVKLEEAKMAAERNNSLQKRPSSAGTSAQGSSRLGEIKNKYHTSVRSGGTNDMMRRASSGSVRSTGSVMSKESGIAHGLSSRHVTPRAENRAVTPRSATPTSSAPSPASAAIATARKRALPSQKPLQKMAWSCSGSGTPRSVGSPSPRQVSGANQDRPLSATPRGMTPRSGGAGSGTPRSASVKQMREQEELASDIASVRAL